MAEMSLAILTTWPLTTPFLAENACRKSKSQRFASDRRLLELQRGLTLAHQSRGPNKPTSAKPIVLQNSQNAVRSISQGFSLACTPLAADEARAARQHQDFRLPVMLFFAISGC